MMQMIKWSINKWRKFMDKTNYKEFSQLSNDEKKAYLNQKSAEADFD